jgi:hypothetical protein
LAFQKEVIPREKRLSNGAVRSQSPTGTGDRTEEPKRREAPLRGVGKALPKEKALSREMERVFVQFL